MRFPISPLQGTRSSPANSFPNFTHFTIRVPGATGSVEGAGLQLSSAIKVLRSSPNINLTATSEDFLETRLRFSTPTAEIQRHLYNRGRPPRRLTHFLTPANFFNFVYFLGRNSIAILNHPHQGGAFARHRHCFLGHRRRDSHQRLGPRLP